MVTTGGFSAFKEVTVLQLALVGRHVIPVSLLQCQVYFFHLSCLQQFQKNIYIYTLLYIYIYTRSEVLQLLVFPYTSKN